MAEPYDALANDYDWLFGDQDIRQGVAINLPATARLLSGLPLRAAVLDAMVRLDASASPGRSWP